MAESIFIVHDDWLSQSFKLIELPISKRTSSYVVVERTIATKGRTRLPIGECFFTPEDAVIDKRREVHDLEYAAKKARAKLDALRAEVFGEAATSPTGSVAGKDGNGC